MWFVFNLKNIEIENFISFYKGNVTDDGDSNTRAKSNSNEPTDISPKGSTKIEQKLDNYTLPKQDDGRSFQFKWLKTFEWLEYSKEKDAAYCYPCRKYATSSARDIFCLTGYNKWSKALAKQQGFKKHETSNTHLSAMLAWKEHAVRLANNSEISSLVNDTVLEKRRYYVKEIISIIWFLAKNECAFRGDWDKENHEGSGLFLNLFKYMLDKDEVLNKCQDVMPKNALYTSGEIQNEMIHIIASSLREMILEEMQRASFYTLMADGTTDKNGDEIFSIAFRYIVDGKPVESLLCFEKAEEKTADALSKLIINQIENHSIDSTKIVSQSYDGASVMSGHIGGVQTLIQNHYSQVIPYIHCISHRLHLVVVEIVTKNDACRLFFDQIKLFHDFFKRHKIQKMYEGSRIPLIIEQRWSGHHKALQSIKANIELLVESLIKIKEETAHNLDAEDVALAIGLLTTTVNRKFIFLMEFLSNLFGIMEPANQILQRRDIGYRQAMPVIQSVKISIQQMRHDSTFNDIMNEANKTLKNIGYDPEPQHPIRRRRRSTLLNDSIVMSTLGERDTDDEIISLKRIYNEIIDTVISEMTRRFDQNNDILLAIESANDFLSDDFDFDKLQPLTALNLTLPTRGEIGVAKIYLLNKRDEEKEKKPKKSFLELLFPCAAAFPATYRMFEAIETFGSGTTTNESSFSALSRIDTMRRRSMTNQRLRDLSFIAFEKKRMDSLKIDNILRKFAEKTRRVQLF